MTFKAKTYKYIEKLCLFIERSNSILDMDIPSYYFPYMSLPTDIPATAHPGFSAIQARVPETDADMCTVNVHAAHVPLRGEP